MTVNLSPVAGAGWQFFDSDGGPLSGGELYTYAAGTTTPQTTYTSSTGLTANIIEFLEDQLKEIEAARYDIVEQSDTSLQQLIDNIIEIYLRTLYKLRFLA